MDFQTAPYDDLCGCVAIIFNRPVPPDHIVQKLIANCGKDRIVEVNCPDCNGSGLK